MYLHLYLYSICEGYEPWYYIIYILYTNLKFNLYYYHLYQNRDLYVGVSMSVGGDTIQTADIVWESKQLFEDMLLIVSHAAHVPQYTTHTHIHTPKLATAIIRILFHSTSR